MTLAMGLLLYIAYVRLPHIPVEDNSPIELVKRLGVTSIIGCDWSIFQSRDGGDISNGRAAFRRFRLAGTFFEYVSDVAGAGDVRSAVIDDLRKSTQIVVKEGERIDDVTVVKIFKDRIVIRDSSGADEQLWLIFSGFGALSKAGTNNTPGTAGINGGNADKFGGQQIGEKRWLFSRERLLEYYKELRDEPDRLVKVFDSLKPIYAGPGKITGYRVGIEGEADFFKSVGLSDGDVVKSVNSMQMTSRTRAEYFIAEFIADRANTFFLDIERENTAVKLQYDVR